MNAQLLHVVAESLPASRKVYHAGVRHADLRVPMREIQLHPSSGEPPLKVYDTSGPYTDPAVTIDIAAGLPRARAGWIAARGDIEAYPGRRVQPIDNGLAGGGKAAAEFPVRRAGFTSGCDVCRRRGTRTRGSRFQFPQFAGTSSPGIS